MNALDVEGKDGSFSGDALADTEDDRNESIKEGALLHKKEREMGWKRVLLLSVPGVSALLVVGFLYWGMGVRVTLSLKETTGGDLKHPWVIRMNIPQKETFLLDSFLIPYKKKTATYVALSISFNVPNNGIKREIMDNRDRIRGHLYEMLVEEVNKGENIPSLDRLKILILQQINGVLSSGKVHEVDLMDFIML